MIQRGLNGKGSWRCGATGVVLELVGVDGWVVGIRCGWTQRDFEGDGDGGERCFFVRGVEGTGYTVELCMCIYTRNLNT